MTSTFAQATNNYSATLTGAHVVADGQLALSVSPGTLAANRVWRLTAVLNPNTVDETVIGIFQATGNTGGLLTGVTRIDGSDVGLPLGTELQDRPTAQGESEVQTAVNAAEAQIAASVERDSFIAYQDFSGYADGPLTTLQVGGTWIQNTIGSPPFPLAVISGGKMGATSTSESTFPTVDLGSGVLPGLVWCTLVFDAVGTSGSAAGLIVSDRNPIDLTGSNATHLIHIIYSDTSWSFGTFTSGTLTYLGSGYYAAPLTCDGVTRYPCGYQISGNTITMYLPDGTQQRFTNSLIGTYNGRYVTFENYVPAGTHLVWYAKVAVENSDLTKLPATGPAFDDLWNSLASGLAQRVKTADMTAAFAAPPVGIGSVTPAAGVFTNLAATTIFASIFTTAGSIAGFVVTRRDNFADAFVIYSAAGNLQVYNSVGNVDVLDISPAGLLTAASFAGNGASLTNLNPANLAGTPAAITGSKAGNTALASLITKLVAAFPNLFSDGTI